MHEPTSATRCRCCGRRLCKGGGSLHGLAAFCCLNTYYSALLLIAGGIEAPFLAHALALRLRAEPISVKTYATLVLLLRNGSIQLPGSLSSPDQHMPGGGTVAMRAAGVRRAGERAKYYFAGMHALRCHRRLPPPPPAAACRLPACPSFVPLPLLLQSSPTPHQHLQALQQLLVQYDYTLPAASLFRPVLLKAVAAMVEAAAATPALAPRSTAAFSPQLAVALLTVLELAPHTQE